MIAWCAWARPACSAWTSRFLGWRRIDERRACAPHRLRQDPRVTSRFLGGCAPEPSGRPRRRPGRFPPDVLAEATGEQVDPEEPKHLAATLPPFVPPLGSEGFWGQRTRTRWTSKRRLDSRTGSPAMMDRPAPGSSSSRERPRGSGRMWRYTASNWCGSEPTWATETAYNRSRVCAKRVRCVSTARRTSRGSASNESTPPATSSTTALSCSAWKVRSQHCERRFRMPRFGMVRPGSTLEVHGMDRARTGLPGLSRRQFGN